MKIDDQNSASVPLETRLAAAQDLARAANYTAAFEIYEALFKDGITAQNLLAGAAEALADAIGDDALPQDWGAGRLIAFVRPIILENARSGTPPALGGRIAAAHAGGDKRMLDKAARHLRGVLSAMWNEECREPGFLIIVLMLRHSLHGWQDEAAISRWHLDLLPQLDRHQLTLPYNGMFDPVHFQRNIDDLTGLIEQTEAAELVSRFPVWQLLLFLWITGSRQAEARLPAWLAEYRSAFPDGAPTEDDGAAVRSLSLRWAVSPHGPTSSAAVTTAIGPDLGRLAEPGLKLRPAPADAARAEKAVARLRSRQWQGAQYVLDQAAGRAPFLKLGRRRPRIAVCVSGQLRGYRDALPCWQASLLRHAECRFFVHSWEKIGRSGAEPFRAYLPFAGAAFCDAWRAHAGRLGMSAMTERYPALFAALADGGIVRHADLANFYGTDQIVLENDSGPKFQGWTNSRKMHYKLKAAADMVTPFLDEFDLIMRIRPDKAIGAKAFRWGDVLQACNSSPTLLADAAMGHQYGALMIGDQVALGAPATMAAYADALEAAPRFHEVQLYGSKADLVGHVSLAQTCWYTGIQVERLPARMGKLLEAEPMTSAAIAQALEQDAAGRHGTTDEALLAAVRSDLAAG